MGRSSAVLHKDFTGIRTVKLNKLEAASRQLDLAIYLYFNTDDCISVHTLAYAACEILDVLLKANGLQTFTDVKADLIKPEYQEEAARLLSDAANFFKHGARDSNAVLEFAPAVNEGLLTIGAWALKSLGRPYTPNRLTYLMWARAHLPQYFKKMPDIPEAAQLMRHFDNLRCSYSIDQKQTFYRDLSQIMATPLGSAVSAAFDGGSP